MDIRSRAPAFHERRFLIRGLVHTTLPHRRLDADTWRREAGRFALELSRVESAERSCTVDLPAGRPYGPKARLLLIYACTWALQNPDDPRLPLGTTLTEFLRFVGLSETTGGGPRSDAALLKEQVLRFWTTSVIFHERSTTEGVHALKVALSNEMRCRWLADNSAAWDGSYMLLTDEFVRHVRTPGVCVPLDLRAVRSLSASSLALDLYALLSNRSFKAWKCGEDLLLSWEQLQEQLGQGYGDRRDFRRAALAALPQVEAVYPRLVAKVQRGGRKRKSGLLVLRRSRPAVAAAEAA